MPSQAFENAPKSAIVLAAGLGKRMRPITNKIPKPLVEVAGRSMLDRNLDKLREYGCTNIVVNAHYLMQFIVEHIATLSDNNITASQEKQLLDQAGGIKAALPNLQGEAFFALNGDAFYADSAAPSLQEMAQVWDPEKMDFLLLLVPHEKSTGFSGPGDFFLEDTLEDNDKCGVIRFRGDAARAPFVYSGVGIFSRAPFEELKEEKYPLVPLFKQAAAKGRLFGMALSGHWFHVGTPEAIIEVEQALKELGIS